ncbi:hypothetical protein L7F22_033795 [Adiantum nelumboides]|nr:hypothetical protein [Adiantum nelumboides]
MSKGKEAMGSLDPTMQIIKTETHLHIQVPHMPDMPDLIDTSQHDEEQQGPVPGSLDVRGASSKALKICLKGRLRSFYYMRKRYTPQQNGVVECKSKHIVEDTYSSSYDMTPEEKFTEKKPNVSQFKVFGCSAYVHVPDELRTKLDSKAEKCVFIGYSIEQKGSPTSSHVANTWSERLRKEASPASSINVSRKGKEKDDECMRMPNVIAEHDDVNGHSSGSDHSLDEGLGIPSVEHQVSKGYVLKTGLMVAMQSHDVEPTCFEEAAENVKWQEAMDKEMHALYGNETWELVPLPKGKKPIGCRWVYKVKHNSDGSVSRYKARLVAKGYTLKDIEHVKALLRKQFDMKDIGELRYFLRIEMIRNEGGIWLSQTKYGLDMLMKMVGNLIYMTISRLDLRYAVGLIHKYRYMAAQILIGLVVVLIGQFNNGYMFSFGSVVVTWSSKKQPTVALLNAEAEYRGAAAVAACEVAWLEMLL